MHSFDRLFDRLGVAMDEVFEQVDARMDSIFAEGAGPDNKVRQRFTNVFVRKGKNKVIITMDVPGLTADDIQLSLERTVLTVAVQGSPMKGRTIDVIKRFRVNPMTDLSDISASVKNGMLTIKVQRDQIASAPTGNIPVQQG